MAEMVKKLCRICLASNQDAYISESSCYAKFFIQVMSLKDTDENLWLCMWCKGAMKRAFALFSLALQSQKAQNVMTTKINSYSLYTLNYNHNPSIDIPPINCLIDANIQYMENITELPPHGAEPNTMDIKAECISEELNAIYIENDPAFEENSSSSNKNKEMNFSMLKFEVEYLNLEEQLKEIEMKKVKHRDFKFHCNDCGMGFLTSDVFEDHKKRHTELNGPHKCNICTLRFKSLNCLSQHMLAHKRRFKCMICKTLIKRWSHCIAHRHRCGGVVELTACEECSKVFTNKHSLKVHMKVHKAKNKYCCDQCGGRFCSRQRLTVHMRSHTGMKPFACTQCDRTFTTVSNMRAHFSVHTATDQYYCVECHTYYKSAKSLKRHFNEAAKHLTATSDVMYSCSECDKQFLTEKSLKVHVNARHETKYRCLQCDKTFSNNSNLNKHVKCIHNAK